MSAEDSFFGLSFDRGAQDENSGIETAEQEVERYLSCSRRQTIESCYAKKPDGKREYPRLAQLFLEYNTALPSSAPVERFFSSAGRSFTDLRNQLGDDTLEQESLLWANKDFWKQ